MKVVCINISPIRGKDGSECYGGGLTKGTTYTVINTIEDRVGTCYRIEELKNHPYGNVKLAERFEPLEDSWLNNILETIKEEVEEEELECV